MRFRFVYGVVVVFLVSACTEAADQGLTNPQVSAKAPSFSALVACGPGTAATVRSEIHRLFGGQDLSDAINLWHDVEVKCDRNFANAPNAMLEYVKFTIGVMRDDRVQSPSTGTRADSLVGHWNSTFEYVGYTPPNLGADVFGPEGAVGVVPANIPLGGQQEIAAANAALTMYSQIAGGDPRGHLFAIAPIAGGCLGGINLLQSGPCFEFSAFPAVSPRFNPGVRVGVCQPFGENDALSGRRPALGHLTAGSVEIPPQTAYPAFCARIDDPAPSLSWRSGFTDVGKRVAWMTRRVLSPQPLYAVHGGLGGVGEMLSPFGAVDLMVFEASLGGETLGGLPGSPDAGNWSSQITKPGKIYTQLGLGSYSDTIIVLNQGGGNCGAKCGGILLQANLFDARSAGATTGVYEVSWVSIQDKPEVKAAPFILRGTNGEIARLEYRTRSSNQELYYNGIYVGRWVRQVPQRFVVRVDLKTKKTSLWFGAVNATPSPTTPVIPFINAGANLTQLAADFRGTDSGIMGWAEIALQRLPDR